MKVFDASAVIEGLVGGDPDPRILRAMTGDICAPHLLDVEVSSVLRGLVLGRVLPVERAEQACLDYADLTIHRYEFEPFAHRVWELRHQFTSYDAAYIALAEALREPLVTCDGKLSSATHLAEVEVFRRPTS